MVYTYSEEDYNCSNSVEIAPLVYSDNCDATASLTITWSMAGATNSGVTTSQVGTQIFNVGVTTVTYTVRDLASNMSSNQFTVTVIDNSAPIVTAIQGNVVTTTSADGGYNCNTAVAISPIVYSDNCTTTPTLTYAMSGANSVNTTIGQVPSPYTFNKGVTYITYVIKDDAVVGNTTTRVVTVTVNDNEFPVISNMPSSVTKDAALGLCNAVHTWTMPSSADNCGVVSFTSNFQSGYAFPVGVTVVVYTAVDAANNATTASFTVTVKDTQLPAIVKTYANVTVNNTPGKCAGIATWPALTLTDATDNCGVATVTSSHVSGSEFPVGTTVVTVTAKDINGNSAAKTFTVTVKDNEKPVIVNLPANVVLDNEGANCYGVGLWTAPTATDNCGIKSLTGSSMSGLHMAIGTTTVTYTAEDINGNVTTASFTVTVKDTGKPVFAGVPANISVNNVAGKCEGVATWVAPTVTDACGTIATVTSNYASGATFAAGVTTVIYTATDNAGNVSTASFTVTVNDNEKPVIAGVPANISLTNAAGKCGAPATWTAPTATDNCGVKTIVSVPASGTEFAVGTTTVTVTATDNSGNVSTAAFTVTVTDTEKPVIACPATLTVKLGWRLDYAVVTEGGLGTPTTSDNCGVKTVTNNFASLYPTGQLKLGTYTVTWTVTDVNGNSSSCTQTIVVNAIPTGTNELSLESALKAWPNPFTDRANIEFSNVNDSHARLEIFSITGAKLKTLFEGNIKGGQSYKAEYTPNGISSQIVIYRLTMGDDVRTGKLIYQGLK